MIVHRSTLNPRVRGLHDCVAPVENVPMNDEIRAITKKYEEDNPITLKIRHRPHIKLKLPEFNLEKARAEVRNFYENAEDFMRMDLNGLTPEEGGKDFWYKGLHAFMTSRALVNYIPESRGVWGKDDRELAVKNYPHLHPKAVNVKSRRLLLQDMNYYKTEVWDALPYITSYIMDNLCEDFNNMRRTHLFRSKPKGCLTFHNHRFLPWDNEAAPHDEGIIHIPLFTHESVNMLSQIGDSDWVDAQHYAPGEVWLFNTFFNHAMDATKCPIDRLHLTITIDFSDKRFTQVIENSL